MVLTATVRFSAVSCALNTAAMPPCPICSSSRYRPEASASPDRIGPVAPGMSRPSRRPVPTAGQASEYTDPLVALTADHRSVDSVYYHLVDTVYVFCECCE